MNSQLAFTIVLLVLLLIVVAHVFACERGAEEKTGGDAFVHRDVPAAPAALGGATSTAGLGHAEKGGRSHNITQYITRD